MLDVQSPLPGLIAHRVLVHSGEVRPGDAALAEVDVNRRRSVSRSHSATHLLHRALRRNLGETASQAGSLNAPGRLRFDFKTPAAVPPSVLGEVEDEINEQLLRDLEVRWFITDQDEARRLGAIAMFGEKYGDRVRVVEMGDYSIELCGGTHVERSAQIGMVKLLNEASIGSGVRRVEALVGLDAFRYLAREHVLVSQLAGEFKAQPEELPERISGVLERLKAAEKRTRAAAGRQRARRRPGPRCRGEPARVGHARARQRRRRRRRRTTCGLLALDVRGRLPGDRAAVVALASPADGGGVSVRDRGQPEPASRPDARPVTWPRCSRPSWALVAAARLTWPRAPVVTPVSSTPPSPRSNRAWASASWPAAGVWLGVDVGSVRVGVAKSDARAQLASPLVTLRRDPKTDSDIDQLVDMVARARSRRCGRWFAEDIGRSRGSGRCSWPARTATRFRREFHRHGWYLSTNVSLR